MYRINPCDTIRFSYGLMGVIRSELLQGRSVEVEGLGSFSLSISYDSKAEHPGSKLNRNSIRDVKIQFRPCKEMKIKKEEITFRKTNISTQNLSIHSLKEGLEEGIRCNGE